MLDTYLPTGWPFVAIPDARSVFLQLERPLRDGEVSTSHGGAECHQHRKYGIATIWREDFALPTPSR